MALRLLGLTKRYGGESVLDRVSLHVRAGDCYGLLGHNGAGKTTALRIALGLVRADEGRVLVEGFDAAAHTREARARLGGLVETAGFHGALSGRENLRLLARLRGLPRRDAAAEADRLLATTGLAWAAGRAVGGWSQGVRQRLGIAQALLGRPRVVLLDEPTNGLDPEGMEEMRSLLRRLTREEGTTVLLSSHLLHEVAAICNRVGILRKGRRVLEEETATLLSAHAGRQVVRTSDDRAAVARLRDAGFSADEPGPAGFEVALTGRPSAEVVRLLVGAGIDVAAVASRAVTLEEVYLHAGEGAAPAEAPQEPVEVGAPAERLAPRWPALRVAAYDLARWSRRPATAVSLLLPCAAATLAVAHRAAQAASDRASVGEGNLASATDVTAFEGVAVALRTGLPALALVLACLGALSLAGEFAGGTLRNVLLRPVRRTSVVLGKALALAAVAVVGAAALAGTSLAASAIWFDFADLEELLLTGHRFLLQPADAVWPDLGRALWMPLPGLAAYAGLGLLVGALCRGGATAMAGTFGVCAALALLPAFAPPAGLPSTYVPMLRDASSVQRLLDTSRKVSNASEPHAGGSLLVPAAWCAAAVAVSCLVLRRRDVP